LTRFPLFLLIDDFLGNLPPGTIRTSNTHY
jgi:hypothetical protein